MSNKFFLNISFHPEIITDFINVGFSDNADIKIHDVGNLPFSDNSVSLIRIKNFIDDLDRNEALRFFYECRRILVPEGVICLLVNNFCKSIISYIEERNEHTWHEKGFDWYDNWCTHLNFLCSGKKWIYDEKELENLAKIVGLSIDKNHGNKFSAVDNIRLADHAEDSQIIVFLTKNSRSIGKNPLVSIVMPCSRIKHFEVALLSALNQTYEKMEIVICDNDESGEIGKAIQPYLKDNRIVYIDNQRDIGGYANFLQCFNVAKGELIKYLNDDDLLDFKCVESLVNCFIENPDITFVTSHRQPIDNDGNLLPDILATKTPVRKSSLIKGITLANAVLESKLNFIGEPTTFMFRKSDLVDNYLMPGPFVLEKSMALGDVVIFLFLCLKGDAIYLTDTLSFFRLHENQAQNKITQEDGAYQWREVSNAFDNIGFNFKSKTILAKGYPCEKDAIWVEENYFNMLIQEDNTANINYKSYNMWFNRHRWSLSAVTRLSNEVAKLGTVAGVHILLVADSGTSNALADTIDSFAAQSLPVWQLTVFSPASCPDPLFETLPPLAWINVAETNFDAMLDTVIANSDADWFVIGIPGLRVEPVFSALVCAAIARHPEWRFIYMDEDRIDSNNQFADPVLKPDANIDLLRSTCYVGNACLIHREIWRQISYKNMSSNLLINYVSALRCYEIFGEQSIGHIDEILFHYPVGLIDSLVQFQNTGMAVLHEHLLRQNIHAEVKLGLVNGSFFIDYLLDRRPLVSIIVPTKDRLDLLKPCLDSLLEKTEYRQFEVLVMDNGSTDPATLDYLKSVTQQDFRVTVLPYVAPYNFSAINNRAAEVAKGEFLVLLNNDTIVIQPNWLDRMLAHGLRDSVGIVGCRLLFPSGHIQHAGVILGMSGVADHIGIDSPMSASGYLNRAQLVQNFSAVTAACMLIRRDLYLELGGLDEQRFPVLFNDVDLCLKARTHGLHVVWTPFSTLIHHGSSSLIRNPDSSRLEDARRSARDLAHQWLPWQAADPAYNRHLSLSTRDWSLDDIHDVPWNPTFESLPCILAVPQSDTNTSYYRLRDPLTVLEQAACARHFLLPNHDQLKSIFMEPALLERTGAGVFLFQDAFIFEWLETIHNVLPHRRLVLCQNDQMVVIAARKITPCAPNDAEVLKEAEGYLRRTLSYCDRLIVADAAMADAFQDMIADIRIVPNYLPRWRWENLVSSRGQGTRPRVGWVGSLEQPGDLAFMLPVVQATCHEVDWVFMGLCSEILKPLIAEFHLEVPFEDYPSHLASLNLDLVVAPFEHNRFIAAKNQLRLLEYGILGWPVICSEDGFYYPDAPISRVPNYPQAWIEAIRKRVHDLPLAWQEGNQLQAWVCAHWMLEDHLEEWHQALLEGFSAVQPVDPKKPELISQLSKEAELSSVSLESLNIRSGQDVQLSISIIICSVDDDRFARVARCYHSLLIEIPHEIIRIDDAKSLCEGYNRGIALSRGEYLVFSHDDIEIWTPDFGRRLLRHLEICDLVGVAGTNLLVDTGGRYKLWKYTSWGAAGLGNVFGRIVEPQGEGYAVVVYGTPAILIEGIQALDGVFFAARRGVVESLRFDEEIFDGFHLYDLDFTYRAFQKGFHLGVFTDIAIVHESSGNYDEQYFNYHRRFLKKFEGVLPKLQPYAWQNAFMVFQHVEEVLAFYQKAVDGMPSIAATSNKTGSDQGNAVALSDISLYRRWCERRQIGEGWAEIVGERMVQRWSTQPKFHLVTWCEPGQQFALADTLESLGQQLYGQWGLSILAPFHCPDGSFAELPNVEWVRIEADADAALRRVLDASALDWFALLEPGDRLAPYALLKIADYTNCYPAWRFIYLDEDRLDLRSERCDPVFRPEFDLDLLLANHYLGDCCLMHRESVLAGGDLPYLPGVTTFQAALRVWEHYGQSAIGHIADVLYHRTAARLPAADAGAVALARRHLVEDHLARRGIAAVIEGALLPGTWRVAYCHPVRPKVSIILLAKDSLDRLDRCLRNLLTKTVYPDYEVLVMDCGSTIEDTLDLYAELKAQYPDQFRVVAAQGPFSVSAYFNQGICEVRGDILIFLTGSALVIQANWIDRLLNHVLRDEVGIVGARLTAPDQAQPFVHGTAQLLGMCGLTGPMFSGLTLRAPGPFGRAQVDQRVSAVSANCLAIRREVFEAINGFDEVFTIAHADTDLCLRAAKHGYHTLWTPFANLAWLGDYPLATGFSHDQWVECSRTDAERMFERWLPKLAADPAYNPNLSLAKPHQIEVELTVGWDAIFHDRPRLLGFPADETGCALYRIYAPLWLLEHQARAECTLIKPGSRLPELPELERMAPDTVLYQGMLGDIGLAAMRQYHRFHRSFKVFDLDDLKHDVPDANSLKERLVRDIKHRHRQGLQHCDRLIVSTEPLAEACRSWIADIQVVPNRLESSRWIHLHNCRRTGPKPRVGWAGAQQHHGDLAFITEVVEQTHDEIDWIFFGLCLDEVRPYVKEVHEWVALNDYPAKLASLNLDLAVAPLELHPFNEAKSNLRILEHGILGRPMVCTDIYPYRHAPVTRVPNETNAWVEAIRAYVHDLDTAEKDGDTLRAWVLEQWILDDHTNEWLRALTP